MYPTLIQTFQTDWVGFSTQYSIVIQNSFSTDYHVFYHPSCTSVLSQLSSITIIYFILGGKSGSPTFLVSMFANCRPPSNQSTLWSLHFSPFLTKLILLETYLVCLVSLPFLAIHIIDFLSNLIRGASSETMSGSLFNNSWIYIQKCAKSIPAVHTTFYSLSAPDWETGPW